MFGVTIRPRQHKHAHEISRAVRVITQFILNSLHADMRVFVWPQPVGGINPRLTAQAVHAQATIIGQHRHARRPCGGQRLDRRVFKKGRAGLFRFRQVQIARAREFTHVITEQCRNLLHFAFVMRGNDEFIAGEFTRHRHELQAQNLLL